MYLSKVLDDPPPDEGCSAAPPTQACRFFGPQWGIEPTWPGVWVDTAWVWGGIWLGVEPIKTASSQLNSNKKSFIPIRKNSSEYSDAAPAHMPFSEQKIYRLSTMQNFFLIVRALGFLLCGDTKYLEEITWTDLFSNVYFNLACDQNNVGSLELSYPISNVRNHRYNTFIYYEKIYRAQKKISKN